MSNPGKRSSFRPRQPSGNKRSSNGSSRTSNRSLGLNSVKIRGPVDPPPLRTDIQVQQRFAYNGSFPSANTLAPIPIHPKDLYGQLPTCVDRFRIQEIHAYSDTVSQVVNGEPAAPAATYAIDPTISLRVESDLSDFQDVGTAGASRAAIHIRPCLALRQQWYEVNDETTVLFTLIPPVLPKSITIGFHLQLLLDVRTASSSVVPV